MKHLTPLLLCIVIISCGEKDPDFDATGTFSADEILVSAEVNGTIESFQAEEGTAVRQGQVLGWIDTTQLHLKKKQLLAQIDAVLSRQPEIATQLGTYRVQLETAERELARVKNLYAAEAATRKQVDDAQAQVNIIRRQIDAHRSSLDISSRSLVQETLPLSVQVEQLSDQVQRARITSPMSGVVLERYADAHELVSPGRPLFAVADLSTLELKAYITGDQLPAIRLGQEVRVFTDDASGGYREQPGVIRWIASKAEFTPKTIQTKKERADLVYPIRVAVPNDGFLKIGMYGEIKF